MELVFLQNAIQVPLSLNLDAFDIYETEMAAIVIASWFEYYIFPIVHCRQCSTQFCIRNVEHKIYHDLPYGCQHNIQRKTARYFLNQHIKSIQNQFFVGTSYYYRITNNFYRSSVAIVML